MSPELAVPRAAALLALEGVALTVLGIIDAIATAVGTPTNRALSFLVAAFGLLGGLVLVLLGRAVSRRRGWARSPAIVLELLAFPVGVGLLQGGLWAAGIPVLLLAGATLWHLFAAGSALVTTD